MIGSLRGPYLFPSPILKEIAPTPLIHCAHAQRRPPRGATHDPPGAPRPGRRSARRLLNGRPQRMKPIAPLTALLKLRSHRGPMRNDTRHAH